MVGNNHINLEKARRTRRRFRISGLSVGAALGGIFGLLMVRTEGGGGASIVFAMAFLISLFGYLVAEISRFLLKSQRMMATGSLNTKAHEQGADTRIKTQSSVVPKSRILEKIGLKIKHVWWRKKKN